MTPTLYQILGVDKTATPAEIRSAYKKQAQQCHPDKHQGDIDAERLFKRIQEAYETLIDAERRATYDATGILTDEQRELRSKAQQQFMGMFSSIIDTMSPGEDITFLLRRAIIESQRQGVDAVKHQENRLKNLRMIASKINYRGTGKNLLTDMVNGKAENLERTIEHNQDVLRVHAEMLRMLDDYEYEVTLMLSQGGWHTGNTFVYT